jgi:hypothetical protein
VACTHIDDLDHVITLYLIKTSTTNIYSAFIAKLDFSTLTITYLNPVPAMSILSDNTEASYYKNGLFLIAAYTNLIERGGSLPKVPFSSAKSLIMSTQSWDTCTCVNQETGGTTASLNQVSYLTSFTDSGIWTLDASPGISFTTLTAPGSTLNVNALTSKDAWCTRESLYRVSSSKD